MKKKKKTSEKVYNWISLQKLTYIPNERFPQTKYISLSRKRKS